MKLKHYLKEDLYIKEGLLLEKTFSISKDVKYIYDKCFKGVIDDIHIQAGSKINSKALHFSSAAIVRIREGKYNWFWKRALSGGYVNDASIEQILSETLPSKQSKEASKVNPAVIACGIFKGGNYYVPKGELVARGQKAPGGGPMDRSYISLSLNGSALQAALTNSIDQIPMQQLKSLYNEFNANRIKATISHEISHWLNDTFHNHHIEKTLSIARELNKPEVMKLHKKDVNMTHFEIDAQIHGIKQLKMGHKKNWDTLELKDVFFEYNSLRYMGGQIYLHYGKEVGDIWQKLIVKRMAREKLLGKNMKGFAKYPEDFK